MVAHRKFRCQLTTGTRVAGLSSFAEMFNDVFVDRLINLFDGVFDLIFSSQQSSACWHNAYIYNIPIKISHR